MALIPNIGQLVNASPLASHTHTHTTHTIIPFRLLELPLKIPDIVCVFLPYDFNLLSLIFESHRQLLHCNMGGSAISVVK